MFELVRLGSSTLRGTFEDKGSLRLAVEECLRQDPKCLPQLVVYGDGYELGGFELLDWLNLPGSRLNPIAVICEPTGGQEENE